MSFTSQIDEATPLQLTLNGIQSNKPEWNISVTNLKVVLQQVEIPKLIMNISHTWNSTSLTQSEVYIVNSTIGHINITGNYYVHVKSCIMDLSNKPHLPIIATSGCNLTVNNSMFFGTTDFGNNHDNALLTEGIIYARYGEMVSVENTKIFDIQFSISALRIEEADFVNIKKVYFKKCTVSSELDNANGLMELTGNNYVLIEESYFLTHDTNEGNIVKLILCQEVYILNSHFSGAAYIALVIWGVTNATLYSCNFDNGYYAMLALSATYSDINIIQTIITNNLAVHEDGGLVIIDSSSAVIADSQMTGNSISGVLPMISMTSSLLQMINTTISGNTATELVHGEEQSLVNVISSVFVNNMASVIGTMDGSSITFNNVNITGNTGNVDFPLVGNIYGNSTFTNCFISNNTITDRMFVLFYSQTTMMNCRFVANTASQMILRFHGNVTSILSNNSFEHNNAFFLIYIQDSLSLWVGNSEFIKNNIKVSLFEAQFNASIYLEKSYFKQNNMSTILAMLDGSRLIAFETSFTENRCVGDESAIIYAPKNSYVEMDSCEFTSNTLQKGYGILLMQTNTTCVITNSLIHGNLLENLRGGVLYSRDFSNVTISMTNITNNIASKSEIVYMTTGYFLMTQSIISQCSLQESGLFSFYEQSNVIIRETIIERNHFTFGDIPATLFMIFCDQNSKVAIESSRINNNHAQGYETLFSCSLSYLTVLNSSVWTVRSDSKTGVDRSSILETHGCSFQSIDTNYTDFNINIYSFFSTNSSILLHNVLLKRFYGTTISPPNRVVKIDNISIMYTITSSIRLAFTEFQLSGREDIRTILTPSMFSFVPSENNLVQKLLTFNSTFLFGTKRMISSSEDFDNEAKQSGMIVKLNEELLPQNQTYFMMGETPYASSKH